MFLICHVTTYLKGFMSLWLKAPYVKSPHRHASWLFTRYKRIYKLCNYSHDLTKPCD